jgi:hypothetical protein
MMTKPRMKYRTASDLIFEKKKESGEKKMQSSRNEKELRE